MTYSKLKKDLLTGFMSIKRMDEKDLKNRDIDKEEVTEDLTRFMLFLEELETKENRGEAKYTDFTNQFNQINNYLKELSILMKKA